MRIRVLASEIKRWIKSLAREIRYWRQVLSINPEDRKIWYFGIPPEANVGDQAQVVCILKFLKKYYPEYHIYTYFSKDLNQDNAFFLKLLKKYHRITKNDKICFQSGYDVTDIGIEWNGSPEIMHRNVVAMFPDIPTVMMPQTINFVSKNQMKISGEIYGKHTKLIFYTRGKRSFEFAKKMMPNVNLINSPDIVTTMIGDKVYEYERNGILLVKRAYDHQSQYSKEEIEKVDKVLNEIEPTDKLDTTIIAPPSDFYEKREEILEQMLDRFAHYKVIVTDRYHGVIFAMITGTPVVVLKTAIHKVGDGVDMFRGVADFDNYIFVCDRLENLKEIVMNAINKGCNKNPSIYFKENFFNGPISGW